ncbi:MAG TPA: hypothetical protein VE944_19315 [Nostoc sp.]|uniref:hypothetical protein n=1 Tax=Nostoc sp. TaxID=1180 RepID=UPI002D3DCC34|nr:hypothetical protein [Nostoc sp.]HYX16472.1 hypothetical protein [Nostoc sp.]
MTLKYRELQSELKTLRNNGIQLGCRLDAEFSILKAEYDKLHPVSNVVTEASPVDDTFSDTKNDTLDCHSRQASIKVLEVRNDDTVVLGIHGEYRVIPCFWDNQSDSAVTINKEVAITGDSAVGRNNDVCKIEIVGDERGSYRAFPITSVEGRCDWLHPDASTRYYQIKARLSVLDSHSSIIEVDTNGQRPDLVTSDDICLCRYYDDHVFGITRYFPSVGTFQRVGGRWLLANRSNGVKWLSVVQAARKYLFPVGAKVVLQAEVGNDKRFDTYRIDKLYYSHLCLMAVCTNERTNLAAIVPMVQLHLPTKGE